MENSGPAPASAMPGFIDLFAPLALLLPMPVADDAVPASDTTEVMPVSPAERSEAAEAGPWTATTPLNALSRGTRSASSAG